MEAAMSANVHVHLHAKDLAASRDFYRKFLGAEPVKEKPGYVKFLPDFAPLNLALTPRDAGEAGSPGGHLGIQVHAPDAVRRHLERVKSAGLAVREQLGVVCCHAEQDKFWVVDPDGLEWEVYYLARDVEDAAPEKTTACCVKS